MKAASRKKRGADPPADDDRPSPINYQSFPDDNNHRSSSVSVSVSTSASFHPQQQNSLDTNNTTATQDEQQHLNHHRGFSTSIYDLFTSPETERVDCCAMTCCGLMQHDRDRYLLQGTSSA
jgi:hypothetical protein